MNGLFAIMSETELDHHLYYGTDYNSNIAFASAGIAYMGDEIERVVHSIENAPFRSAFRKDKERIKGKFGVGVISSIENDVQPMIFKSNIGRFAICTNSSIRNAKELSSELKKEGINLKHYGLKRQTELVGNLIKNQIDHEGKDFSGAVEQLYEVVDGDVTLVSLLEDEQKIVASGGVFPLTLGVNKKAENGPEYVLSSQSSAFTNLGFEYDARNSPDYREIMIISEDGIERIKTTNKRLFCTFSPIYFGFSPAAFYGIYNDNVRYRCGASLRNRDDTIVDFNTYIESSGISHGIGVSNREIELINEARELVQEKKDLYKKGLIDFEELDKAIEDLSAVQISPQKKALSKFGDSYSRGYMQSKRPEKILVSEYKLIPNPSVIRGARVRVIDDSLRTGDTLRRIFINKVWPYEPVAIHLWLASSAQIFPCYFDVQSSGYDLLASTIIKEMEGRDIPQIDISPYLDVNSEEHNTMCSEVAKRIKATSVMYQSLEDMIEAVVGEPGNICLRKDHLCLYCWNGVAP